MPGNNDSIATLKAAFQQKNLSLYLGAGISIESGIPSWDKLVLALYFQAAAGDWIYNRSPFPNYLYAIAEWQLERDHEPLDITARKIRHFYSDDETFFDDLRTTIYAGLKGDYSEHWHPDACMLRQGNRTLDGVASLCEGTNAQRGVRTVITYNYDNLVEAVTAGFRQKFVPVWKSSGQLDEHDCPIVHVHGYIPPIGEGSPPGEIVLTEEQYHAAAHSPYSWSNLAQIQCLSSSVGLMVGLSLSDRNMRRLLDALRSAPLKQRRFALLRKPRWAEPKHEELEQIHNKAISYFNRFEKSGAKKSGPRRNEEMLGIIQELNRLGDSKYTDVLNEMGITPIWFDDYDEVGEILKRIAGVSPI